MNKVDKSIAVFGIIVIVILCIIAGFLLLGDHNSSPIRVTPELETVELSDDSVSVSVTASDETDIMVYNGPIVSKGSDNKNASLTSDNAANTTQSDGKYSKKKLLAIKNKDAQMAELFGYWEDSRLEAVYDLINLDRVRNLTKDLAGTDGYYYYGEVNDNNIPEGKGLAIYADDTYYFGTWKAGLRDGNGMLLQIFPDNEATVGKYKAVKEHFYTGEFKNDLPNGTGQENYVYNTEMIDSDDYILDVIGSFKNGYYDSELIIYTVDKKGKSYEWRAEADEGTFILCEQGKISTTGKKPVWEKGKDNNHSTDESDSGYYWMKDSDNLNWGVWGLMK